MSEETIADMKAELEALRAENKDLRSFVANAYFNAHKSYQDYYHMLDTDAKILKLKYNIEPADSEDSNANSNQ